MPIDVGPAPVDPTTANAEVMNEEPNPISAWQPFTPAGVAAFAWSSWTRLLLAQGVIASLIAGVLVWFFIANCTPAILQAIRQMPDEAVIDAGELKNVEGKVFSETRFLSLSAVTAEVPDPTSIADLRLLLRPKHYQICWIAGCASFVYPRDRVVPIGRSTAEPWWGAWSWLLLAALAVSAIVTLFLSWTLMSLIYGLVVRTIAYFADRELSWPGAWRLSGAALLPGATLMAAGLVFYGSGIIDLVRLGIFLVLHLILGWIYVGFSPFCLPKAVSRAAPLGNPFAKEEAKKKSGKSAASPFASPSSTEPESPPGE